MSFLVSLPEADNVAEFGGKAVNLAKLLQAGLPVPNGFAVSVEAFDEHGKLSSDVEAELVRMLDKSHLYAVRSSALAEDAEGESWAGQFETFLNTEAKDVIAKIEICHNSVKERAKSYGGENKKFDIAVVVQEMLDPEYAGVLFTKDPVTGEDHFVVEYVEGLGEQLVSGQVDPARIVIGETKQKVPFEISSLVELANKVLEIFGVPQDIEWVWASNKMWLVQARPITATQTRGKGYYLGEPEELFYWGPSRAKALYMSDFMESVEQFFVSMARDPAMPTPPKTLVLFTQGKMVWLSNNQTFGEFTEATFTAYKKRGNLGEDMVAWQSTQDLIQAWTHTLFAEFSLYGAESAIAKMLTRFDDKTKQEIWGAFTVPDDGTFLSRIDEELLASENPNELAEKYPWIQDGYDGVFDNPQKHFEERLKILQENPSNGPEVKKDRARLAEEYALTKEEVDTLDLARGLADFMDQRKEWMMRTRQNVTERKVKFENGWRFNKSESSSIDAETVNQLWERYIDFKASNTAVKGIVASNGGKHFINGEVSVVSSPTDSIPDDKILVVPSTSPSYVPLMRKARALVTDHGGMMSHAAIVAREFGLPCIVGTKQATKVLKDGDKVVLDLVKGEVNL